MPIYYIDKFRATDKIVGMGKFNCLNVTDSRKRYHGYFELLVNVNRCFWCHRFLPHHNYEEYMEKFNLLFQSPGGPWLHVQK